MKTQRSVDRRSFSGSGPAAGGSSRRVLRRRDLPTLLSLVVLFATVLGVSQPVLAQSMDQTNGLSLGDTAFGRGVAWGDYDNDGDLDLYLANSGQANKLLRNHAGSGQSWLKGKVVGTFSNRAGISARVRVAAEGVSQIRDISGGLGWGSQDAMIASLGLSAATPITLLEVTWPSGIVQVVNPVPAVDQAITVVETSGPTAVEPTAAAIPVAYQLGAAVPNPFNPSTTIRFDLPQSGQVELAIYDVAGRRVRTLVQETRAAGRHEVVWQGTDDNGRPVASGIYLYRLEAGLFRETRRGSPLDLMEERHGWGAGACAGRDSTEGQSAARRGLTALSVVPEYGACPGSGTPPPAAPAAPAAKPPPRQAVTQPRHHGVALPVLESPMSPREPRPD